MTAEKLGADDDDVIGRQPPGPGVMPAALGVRVGELSPDGPDLTGRTPAAVDEIPVGQVQERGVELRGRSMSLMLEPTSM